MLKKWGSYKVLGKGKDWKVKLLLVNPHKATSLQTHALRKEIWFDLDTESIVLVGQGDMHKLENNTDEVKRIIEIQTGKCLERDIKRYKENDGEILLEKNGICNKCHSKTNTNRNYWKEFFNGRKVCKVL